MALNTLKCINLIPLGLKGLTRHLYSVYCIASQGATLQCLNALSLRVLWLTVMSVVCCL